MHVAQGLMDGEVSPVHCHHCFSLKLGSVPTYNLLGSLGH